MHEVERVAWTAEHHDLADRIAAHPFERADHALDFTGRLARDRGWSPTFARGAVAEYRRFCFLAMVFDTPVTPSEEVDEVWHQHLTYSRDYWDVWCGQVLRGRLHHDPTEGGSTEQGRYRMQYAETLARYESFFGPPDPRFWPATHRRFRRRPRYRIVDGDRCWILPRPAFHGWFGRTAMAAGLALTGNSVTPMPASALPLDPLDWTAGPFLTLYTVLGATALLTSLALRSVLRGTGRGRSGRDLDVVEVAFLAGGPKRAADAVIVGLIHAGAASVSTRSGHLTLEDRDVALPASLERFRGLAEGTVQRSSFMRTLKPKIDAERKILTARGLVPHRGRLVLMTAATLVTVGPVLALGVREGVSRLGTGQAHRLPDPADRCPDRVDRMDPVAGRGTHQDG